MSDVSVSSPDNEQSQNKTIPMLEAELKAIKDKIAIIANIASCAHPYTPFDRFYFDMTISSIKEMIIDLTNGTQSVMGRVKESRLSFLETPNKEDFLLSCIEALSRLSTLANELEEVGILISAYTSQYHNHA